MGELRAERRWRMEPLAYLLRQVVQKKIGEQKVAEMIGPDRQLEAFGRTPRFLIFNYYKNVRRRLSTILTPPVRNRWNSSCSCAPLRGNLQVVLQFGVCWGLGEVFLSLC